MKIIKVVFLLAIFIASNILTVYFLKSIHPIIFKITGGIGIAYLIYSLLLLIAGVYLSRYLFRLGKILTNFRLRTIALSSITGIGFGAIYSSLIGLVMFLY